MAATARTEDGVDIAVHDLGGKGRTLLMAHATGFHGRAYTSLARALGDVAHGVAFDERGHGESGLPPALDFAWHGFALDVLAVVDELGLEAPMAFGHSCGGTALLLAEEKRPGTFHSIHCYEPIMFPGADPPPPPPGSNLATGARRRREVFPSRDLAFDNYAGKPPFASFTPEALRDYVTYGFDDLPDGTVRLKCRGENEARVYEGGFSHDAFAHLDEIECPVTIACGALSDIGVPTMEAVAARLRHGHLDVLDGLSHFGPFEDPDAVALSILRAAVTPRA